MHKITVFDVETPNSHSDRICSIGFTYIIDNEIVGGEHYLVNPETYFSPQNMDIHGISPKMVVNEKTFDVLWNQEIKDKFSDCIILAHNAAATDLCVLRKTLEYYKIELPTLDFMCTLRIAEAFRGRGAGKNTLDNLCDEFGISFLDHHNAQADSMACAQIYLKLLNNYGFDYKDYVCIYSGKPSGYKRERVLSDYDNKKDTTTKLKYTEETQSLQLLQGILLGIVSDDVLNESEVLSLTKWLKSNLHLAGHYPFDKVNDIVCKALEDNKLEQHELDEMLMLFKEFSDPIGNCCCIDTEIKLDVKGKLICLTGDFEFGSRSEVENRLKALGACCSGTVGTKTDCVVVGSLGSSNWKFGSFGGKFQKAYELIEKDYKISIFKESDFFALLGDEICL